MCTFTKFSNPVLCTSLQKWGRSDSDTYWAQYVNSELPCCHVSGDSWRSQMFQKAVNSLVKCLVFVYLWVDCSMFGHDIAVSSLMLVCSLNCYCLLLSTFNIQMLTVHWLDLFVDLLLIFDWPTFIKFEFLKFGFKIRIWFAYIWYWNLGFKFVYYFHLVKIGNAYNK